MAETITIAQYRETEPLELPDSTIDHLLTTYTTQVEVKPASDGKVILRGNNYVGLVRTPELDLLIAPKVPTLSVFWMLGFAQRLVRFAPESTPYDVEPGLLDLLARLFARQTEHVLRRGIHRAYVEREDNLGFVRGRILPLDDVRANRGLHHRAVCRFGELTSDILENRILRAVTEQLLRYDYRLPGIREQLAWNAAHLADVSVVPMSERDFGQLRYGRLNSHYRGVHALARLIVRHHTFAFVAGQHHAPAFLVDMDDIFEEYLRRLIEEEARPMGFELRRPGSLYLDVGREIRVNPDIVLTNEQGAKVAIDAKYKLQDKQADVYQALAYAKALGLRRVALVYPADGEVSPGRVLIRNDESEIVVATIPVGHGGQGFVDLERRARRSASRLLSKLRADLPVEAAA